MTGGWSDGEDQSTVPGDVVGYGAQCPDCRTVVPAETLTLIYSTKSSTVCPESNEQPQSSAHPEGGCCVIIVPVRIKSTGEPDRGSSRQNNINPVSVFYQSAG